MAASPFSIEFRTGDIVSAENDWVLNRATTSAIEAFKANELEGENCCRGHF